MDHHATSFKHFSCKPFSLFSLCLSATPRLVRLPGETQGRAVTSDGAQEMGWPNRRPEMQGSAQTMLSPLAHLAFARANSSCTNLLGS